jgi:glycine/D-amino acid oxidase-like deaminating enzyme/nitrite reductase/ring-hydroxylating ferredoxin subunit
MNVSDERTRSVWMDTEVAPDASTLDQSLTADTVIVGAGITGLSTAYELACRGQSVVVLDRGPIGYGMTARTTAHLTSLCDDSFDSLIQVRGIEMAKLFHQSHAASIDRMEEIQQTEQIDCEFRRLDGILFPALGSDPSDLDSSLESSRKAGMDVIDGNGLPFNGLGSLRCLRYPRQGTFHPLKYLKGVARAIKQRKGRLYADTIVQEIEEKDGRVIVKTTSGHTVQTAAAVVATNAPINDRLAIHSKQAPYRTYAMAFAVPRSSMPDALYWDTLDDYHYVRLQPGSGRTDILIVGGADHKSGEADDADIRFEALAAWMRNLLPKLGKERYRWSGQVMNTLDFMSFTGRNPGSEHVYVHTGDSGQGITHGVVASLILSGLITEGSHPWAEAYDPARKPLKAASRYVSENLTALKNFAEYVAPGELDSIDELKPGCGAIIRDGTTKIAAFRAKDGTLMVRSAVCTHLACHVHWNSLERCWDCPCHGSHFAVDGTCLNGPAIAPLAEVETPSVAAPKRERRRRGA